MRYDQPRFAWTRLPVMHLPTPPAARRDRGERQVGIMSNPCRR
jgi:hypothetical protein